MNGVDSRLSGIISEQGYTLTGLLVVLKITTEGWLTKKEAHTEVVVARYPKCLTQSKPKMGEDIFNPQEISNQTDFQPIINN